MLRQKSGVETPEANKITATNPLFKIGERKSKERLVLPENLKNEMIKVLPTLKANQCLEMNWDTFRLLIKCKSKQPWSQRIRDLIKSKANLDVSISYSSNDNLIKIYPKK